MKLVLDEKLKHRLIGLAVIISLGAIFAPAVMKKSGQHLDNNFSVNVKLPPKPLAPDVVIKDEKELFKTIKVAKIELPAVPEQRQLTELVQAEPIKTVEIHEIQKQVIAKTNTNTKTEIEIKSEVDTATNNPAKSEQLTLKKASSHMLPVKTIQVAAVIPAKQAMAVNVAVAKPSLAKQKVHLAKLAKPVTEVKTAKNNAFSSKEVYAVQLASFTQLSNAQALVNRLRGKGYKANYTKIANHNKAVYKVYAGYSPRKNDALKVKTQLASSMRLNGFVVNTGVS